MKLRKRNFWIFLGILGFLAFVIRLVIARQLLAGDSMVARPPASTDAATYLRLAEAYATGGKKWGTDAFYYQPFYYAVFLPLIRLISGSRNFVAATGIAQAALGAASVVFIGLAFARLHGRKVGLAAAAILMLARMHVFYTPYLLIASLQSFWMAALTYLGVVAWHRPKLWRWALAGVVCGLAIVTRGNMQLFIPLLLALAIWRHRKDRRFAIIAAIVVLVCTQLPQLPFSIANYKAAGSWSGPSTAAGAVLALGNTPEAPPGGRDAGTGAGPMEYPFASTKWMEQSEATPPISVPTNIIRWVKQEPLAYVELKWRMLLLFWHRSEIPNNVAIETMGKKVRAPLLHVPIFLDFWFIGSLGLCGLMGSVREWRKRPAIGFAGGAVLLYCASIVVFYVLARFRLPMIPVLCGFAGMGTIAVFDAVRERRRLRFTLATLAGSALLVCFGYDAYRYGWESRVMKIVRPNGVKQIYADELSIRDNGPFSFGGWLPILTQSEVHIEKTFALTIDEFLNDQAGTPWRERELRVKLLGDSSRQVGARIGEQAPVLQTVDRGIGELILPIAVESVREENGQLVVAFVLRSPQGMPGVLVDMQRQYQRTLIKNAVADGELVVEIRCR